MFKKYIEDNVVITDGAMGTYYSQITGKETTLSEWANNNEPDIIKWIHNKYIKAGANLIRTNTFSANTVTLQVSREKVKELLINGYKIALQSAKGKEVFVAADIGPIPEIVNGKEEKKEFILDEYKFLIDTFYNLGAKIYLFETFSDLSYFKELSQYIKNKDKNCYIITQFALTENGYTRKGISVTKIIKFMRECNTIDAFGFNCGVGPTHLKNIIEKIDFGEKIITALPNAGYPEIVNERTVYTQNADYFAEIMLDIKRMGVKIIGGCCGTTPVHIEKIVEKIKQEDEKEQKRDIKVFTPPSLKSSFVFQENRFKEKMKDNKFVIAVELDPPFDIDISNIKNGAESLKESGVDIITIADSPLGRARIDSVMMAAKIKREIGIDTMPHITCRDTNVIGLKSKLMAGYIEGIRNILLVTGDPVPSGDRNEIESVFNLNSFKLMELVKEMNLEKFRNDPYYFGGALNLNTLKKEKEIERMERKIKAGARFFLTQPVFEEEVIRYLKNIKRPDNVKILVGIMPLVSYKNAQFLNNEIPGITIPSIYINRFNDEMSKEEGEREGIKIAVELIKEVKNFVDGLYFITPFDRVYIIKKILDRIKFEVNLI
ncbi:MAG: methionine synthase / methylenetetrahydrofolate reductase [Halanaerobiales bacterium]|nr:methionine synthase / methylenetetrahydrofolate reductase [Halanaerobiales bacterium]